MAAERASSLVWLLAWANLAGKESFVISQVHLGLTFAILVVLVALNMGELEVSSAAPPAVGLWHGGVIRVSQTTNDWDLTVLGDLTGHTTCNSECLTLEARQVINPRVENCLLGDRTFL